MNGTVWLQTGQEQPRKAGEGDVVLTPAGDVVRIAEVRAGGDVTPCAEVATHLLPDLPHADTPQRIDDEDVLRAVRGVLEAERDRGA